MLVKGNVARAAMAMAALAALCAAALAGTGGRAPAANAAPRSLAPSRAFEFTYAVAIRGIKPGSRVRVWIPEATNTPSQRVRVLSIKGTLPLTPRVEPVNGDHMLYAVIPRAATGEYHATIAYRVTRYLRGEPRAGGAPPDPPSTAALQRALEPNKLVPITGIPAQLAAQVANGQTGTLAKVRAIYDFVLKTMRYDKSGQGWGRGDVIYACNAHRGNCTDFHSLFIAMARSQKIPARFEIGFAIPTNAAAGPVPGYHCWADFYLPGRGWIPVDAAEAWLDPAERSFLFGHLDPDRVEFSRGRDLVLSPPQAGPPLNYFVYPYVEVNGKPYSGVTDRFAYSNLAGSRHAIRAGGK